MSIRLDQVRGYAVCSEPRSGTTYLCALLRATGVLGAPREFFNPNSKIARSIEGYGPAKMVPTVLSVGATPNGVYGVKVFSDVFDNPREPWCARLPNLSFVSFEREDLLAQAISWARAVQSGQYLSAEPAAVQPSYDPALIAYFLRVAARGQARWRQFFARNGLTPLRLTYEDLVADPQAAVDRIARLVDVEAPPIDHTNAPSIQRDDLSAQWRERFLRERGDLSRLDGADIDAGLALGRTVSRARWKLNRLRRGPAA